MRSIGPITRAWASFDIDKIPKPRQIVATRILRDANPEDRWKSVDDVSNVLEQDFCAEHVSYNLVTIGLT